MRPELGGTGFREHRIAKEVVVVRMSVHNHQRERSYFAHGIQDFLSLPRAAAGIDHHGPLGSYDQAGVELRTFGHQHIVVRADFEPS